MQEIERKYLLSKTIISFLKTISPRCEKYTQFYTKVTSTKSTRYRKIGKKYFQTKKVGTGGIRKELEREVSLRFYEKKMQKRIGHIIKKKRCLFVLDDFEYSVDIYKNPIAPLYILEVEFSDIETYEAFHLPAQLNSHIVREVTEDEVYKNKNLALFGLPLGENSPKRMGIVFPKILKQLFQQIIKYRQKVCSEGDEEDLHQLRIALRKTVVILNAFSFIFEKEMIASHSKMLKKILSLSNTKRDLDVLQKYLHQHDDRYETALFKNALQTLETVIDKECLDEKEKIVKYLQSDACSGVFNSYEDFIENVSKKDYGYSFYDVTAVAKFVIYKRYMKIKSMISKLTPKGDEEILHKLRIEFKKLRYLLEIFSEFFDDKEIKYSVKYIKKLQNLLGDFHDTYQQRHIFSNLAQQYDDENIRFVIQNGILPELARSGDKNISMIEDALRYFVRKSEKHCSCFGYKE